jgi:hypothetical protein
MFKFPEFITDRLNPSKTHYIRITHLPIHRKFIKDEFHSFGCNKDRFFMIKLDFGEGDLTWDIEEEFNSLEELISYNEELKKHPYYITLSEIYMN